MCPGTLFKQVTSVKLNQAKGLGNFFPNIKMKARKKLKEKATKQKIRTHVVHTAEQKY